MMTEKMIKSFNYTVILDKTETGLALSKGPESQLILVMDNFHCTCYYWSSEPKEKKIMILIIL